MPEKTFTVEPTILVLDRPGDETLGWVAVRPGEDDEALLVFRGPEDAFAFQERTGLYTAREGYVVISMTPEALGALLEREGIEYVVMPEAWTGAGMAHTFKAESFIAMLAESPPA